MRRLQSQGVHHNTIVGANRRTSIDFWEDPLDLLIELGSYRFEPPAGFSHAEVLLDAHRIRRTTDRREVTCRRTP